MISKKYRTLVERRLARLEKAINEDMRCESLDDIDERAHDWFVSQEWDEDDYWVRQAGDRFSFIQKVAARKADPIVDACCDAIGVDYDSPERDIVENALAEAADICLADPGYWDDEDDDDLDDEDDDWDDDEDDMYESRRRKLEHRVRLLERKFASKRMDERGLLRGVVGKVNASGEDAEAIAAILKDKYKIPDSVITSKGDKYSFKLNISFYDKEVINELLERYAEKHKGSLADNIIVYYYSLNLSESENDKMTAQLKKGNVKFNMDDGASRDITFKGKSEVLDEIKGLNMASYDKVAKTLVDMLKKNIDQNVISNICNDKEALELINKGMDKVSSDFAKSLVRELEAKSPYKVEWGFYRSYGDMKIDGTFHINDGGKETGQYDVDISIGNKTIYVYHHGKGDRKEVYRNKLTGDIVKDFNNAVMQSAPVNRGKIEAGRFDFRNTPLD